jgi:1,2-diacylglycerol 3-alpha-glucosyltransferase
VRQDNIGNIISSIEIKKKKIVVTFASGHSLTLSSDQYTQDYFYVGKVIDDKKVEELSQSAKSQPFIDYGFRLLSKGRYTEYQIREKLYKREALKPQVDEVISRLKLAHLIDDASLLKDWVHHYQKRGYGLRVIKTKLHEKGFFPHLLETIQIETDIELESISRLIDQSVKKYQRLSERERKQKITTLLLQRGYESKVYQSILEAIPTLSKEQSDTNLKEAFDKAMRMFQSRFDGRQRDEKIINFLLRKGYTYSNIVGFLKESKHGH